MSDLIAVKPNSLVDTQAQKIIDYLQSSNLPSDNIIAPLDQRLTMGNNLPEFLGSLPPDVTRDARYLSKFVVGAAIGLFDYSLNAVWNEVVLELRRKAIVYGLDIFFDAAVGGGKNREFYETEDDLATLKDANLLNTCRNLEIISDILYKKLKHILDMRNDIGISHPNTASVSAYELLSWLEICVKEVLQDSPTDAALQAKAFLGNLKSCKTVLSIAEIQGCATAIANLPSHLCGTLLRNIFGLFVDPTIDITVKKMFRYLRPLCGMPAWKNLNIS